MRSKIPLYRLAPVTASTAEFLVKVYGAESIDEYVKSLPQSAHILDVGAGNSELGKVVTSLRTDIIWTNFDPEYTVDKLSQLKQKASKNLKFLEGDILNPSGVPSNSYDIVYAFWVLPHLGLEDPALIKTGIKNMLNLLRDDQKSMLVVGPLMAKRTGRPSTNYLTASLRKDAKEKEIAELARDCTIPSSQAPYFKAINRAGLATLKNGERTGQEPTRMGLWDIERGQYVKALSKRGLFLLANFRVYLAIEKFRNNRR